MLLVYGFGLMQNCNIGEEINFDFIVFAYIVEGGVFNVRETLMRSGRKANDSSEVAHSLRHCHEL